MTDEPDDRAEKTRAMKGLSEDDRRGLIDAGPNVYGYDRFMHRRKQVELRDSYRKPVTPDPGGKA